MPPASLLTVDERSEIEALIRSFDGHGCGFGLDLKAQVALRRLLRVLDEAERTIETYRATTSDRRRLPDGPSGP